MAEAQPLNVWESDLAADFRWAARAVQDGLVKPAFKVALVASRGDSASRRNWSGRGAHMPERVEEWPGLPDETRRRFLLVVKEWPAG
jgi:hypothetical protein